MATKLDPLDAVAAMEAYLLEQAAKERRPLTRAEAHKIAVACAERDYRRTH